MTSSTIRNAIFGVAGVTFLSKFLGFLREMVIADRFGTSALYDTYLIAIMLPALLAGIFNYAGVYLLVPFLSRKMAVVEEPMTLKSVWPVVNSYFLLSVLATALIYFFAPLAMKLWAGEYGAEEFARIVFFARLTSLMVILMTIEAISRAFLNVRSVFTYTAAGYIVFNLFSIGAVLLFSEQLSIGAVALGLVGGLVLQNIYLLARVFGLIPRFGFCWSLFGVEARTLLATASLLLLIEAINRSYFLIDRYFAAPFGEGIISALNYCQVLVQLPDAVVGFAIGTVLFPFFARATMSDNQAQFGKIYSRAISAAVLIAIPLAGFVYVGAEELISLVFQRGRFDAYSVEITSLILRPYAPTIVALFIISTSIRAAYSGGWAKPVLGLVLVAFVLKFTGTAYLPEWLGYPGISAATSLAFLVMALLLVFLISRRTVGGERKVFTFFLARMFLAGPIATVAVLSLKEYALPTLAPSVPNQLLMLTGVFAAVALLFLVVLVLLGGGDSLTKLIGEARKRSLSGESTANGVSP
ncbi:MAG: lipid II flippase MurJ [bacterium]|nr:lipid II flippase MurJ [bacterium]